MKKQKNIIIAGLILLLGVLVWYVWSGSEPEVVQQVKQQLDKPAEQAAKKDGAAEKPLLVTEVLNNPDAHPAIIKRIKKVQKFQSLKTAGFSYYGRVIDQHGDPVVGANVQVDIGYYPFIPNGNFYPSHKIISLVTDAEGKFSIVGEKGESVRIDPVPNSEYDFSYPDLFALTFSRVGIKGLKKISDPANPVIFHAWKKTEAESLYYSEGFYGFYKSGFPYTIDLHRGKKIEGRADGDLEIVFNRTEDGSRSDPSNWSVTIKAKMGGLLETTDLFMNEAPVSGYIPSWKISFKKSSPDYKRRIEKHFYIKSRNGNAYSKVKMRFLPYYKDDVDVIEIKAWLNPRGSRNLQYDPSKRIHPR